MSEINGLRWWELGVVKRTRLSMGQNRHVHKIPLREERQGCTYVCKPCLVLLDWMLPEIVMIACAKGTWT